MHWQTYLTIISWILVCFFGLMSLRDWRIVLTAPSHVKIKIKPMFWIQHLIIITALGWILCKP